jgi:hypothetical protein
MKQGILNNLGYAFVTKRARSISLIQMALNALSHN